MCPAGPGHLQAGSSIKAFVQRHQGCESLHIVSQKALVSRMERSSVLMQEDLWVLQCSRWLQDNSYAQPPGTADVLACQLLQLHRCRTFYQLCKVRD